MIGADFLEKTRSKGSAYINFECIASYLTKVWFVWRYHCIKYFIVYRRYN